MAPAKGVLSSWEISLASIMEPSLTSLPLRRLTINETFFMLYEDNKEITLSASPHGRDMRGSYHKGFGSAGHRAVESVLYAGGAID